MWSNYLCIKMDFLSVFQRQLFFFLMLVYFQCLNVHASFRRPKYMHTITPLTILLRYIKGKQTITCPRTLAKYLTYHFLTGKHFVLIPLNPLIYSLGQHQVLSIYLQLPHIFIKSLTAQYKLKTSYQVCQKGSFPIFPMKKFVLPVWLANFLSAGEVVAQQM